jgi:hypothetical protein
MDNSSAVDIANSQSAGGRMHHVDVRNYFLCELKDQGLFVIKHIAGERNNTDIFTKNVTSAIFVRLVKLHVDKDVYVSD